MSNATTTQPMTFEGTCYKCQGRVTGNGVSKPWRHDSKPATKHQPHPTGELRQI